MALKIASLGRGYSGVRVETLRLLEAMLAAGVAILGIFAHLAEQHLQTRMTDDASSRGC